MLLLCMILIQVHMTQNAGRMPGVVLLSSGLALEAEGYAATDGHRIDLGRADTLAFTGEA